MIRLVLVAASVVLICGGSCIPWVGTYGQLEPARHVTKEMFAPDAELLVWSIWNDKWQ